MPKKSTSHLENELKRSESLEAFLDNNQDELSREELPELLQVLADSRGMTKADIVKASNLNEIYAYQILSGARRPSRDKLLCMCFALKATLEETQDVLKKSGFAPLYARNQRDSIIMYALVHEKNIHELNIDLYDHGEAVVE